MALSLKIDFPLHPFRIIEPNSNVMLLGSCFTENIGELMLAGGINVNINPFGILFNPISLSNAILRIHGKTFYTHDDLFENHEHRFVSFDHHGRYSGYDADQVLEKINTSIEKAHLFLKKADCLIITFGSAWVYKHLKNDRIVANCHKVPSKEFSRSMLEVDEIDEVFNRTLQELRSNYPDLNIIFTISPVKHLRDGVTENLQSKSSLVLSCMHLMNRLYERVYYFPAYEIVTEELRDYRFYETDHAHPNQLAVNYLWERFTEICFKENALEKIKATQMLGKAMDHRSLHGNGNQNLEINTKIKEYLKKYPLRE